MNDFYIKHPNPKTPVEIQRAKFFKKVWNRIRDKKRAQKRIQALKEIEKLKRHL
tara:strand:+ start:540 stop:701 length:162 start_codon:yes stop_codon:yes gene_type:complete